MRFFPQSGSFSPLPMSANVYWLVWPNLHASVRRPCVFSLFWDALSVVLKKAGKSV